MCGRFYIADEDMDGEIQRIIDEAARKQKAIIGADTVARGEVAPGMTAAALALGKRGDIGAFPMEWGFTLGNKRIINTRLETAAEKPLFRDGFLQRRCLMPLTHYFEWGDMEWEEPSLLAGTALAPRKTKKNRWIIRPEREGQVYLAGIYRYEPEKKLPVFSVLTCVPDASIGWLHDRMPVLLHGEHAMAFLTDEKAVSAREQRMIFRAG